MRPPPPATAAPPPNARPLTPDGGARAAGDNARLDHGPASKTLNDLVQKHGVCPSKARAAHEPRVCEGARAGEGGRARTPGARAHRAACHAVPCCAAQRREMWMAWSRASEHKRSNPDLFASAALPPCAARRAPPFAANPLVAARAPSSWAG